MHHWGYFHPICFLFIILIIGLIIANIRMWRGKRGYCSDRLIPDSFSILDKRLASGEISVEEYEKLKEILMENKK
ncbi:MAG: SHOCT domain-containing protein [Heyndrickxia sp.]